MSAPISTEFCAVGTQFFGDHEIHLQRNLITKRLASILPLAPWEVLSKIDSRNEAIWNSILPKCFLLMV